MTDTPHNSNPPSPFSPRPLLPRNVRRHLLPLASTAALGLTGCMSAQPAKPTADLSPQQDAVQRVQNFTAGMDTALDKVDPVRLTMAADLNAPPTTPLAASPAISKVDTHLPLPVEPPPKSLVATSPNAPAISATPIATLTSVNQGASGVPANLITMTAMASTSREMDHSLPTVASPGTQPATRPATVAITKSAPAPTAAPASIAVVSPVQATFTAPPAAAVPVEPTVDAALAVLRKQTVAHPTLNSALALALLDSAQGKAPDPAASAALSAPDQKLLSDLLAALEGMTTPITASTTLADRASPLVDAAKKWQANDDLTLPKLALASRVDSFGVYTPVEAKFPQGSKRTVIIYCEVANFASKKTDDRWYETHLSQQDTLITEDGLLIWRPSAEEVEDRSMNQRRDFYLVKRLTIPDTLAAGKYTLRMSVTDHTTNKFAMTNLPIEITEK